LKINEYLAAGRPVVATDFSEDIQEFDDVIYIGHDHEEFVRLIDRGNFDENSEQKDQERTCSGKRKYLGSRLGSRRSGSNTGERFREIKDYP
jgi:hypothetical protein